MGARKIQDETEVIRWFEQGLTYEEMSRRYLDKYDIVMTPSAWGNFRRRRGLERRINRDDELIPWAVKLEHRHDYPIIMLRREARRRAGMPLSPEDEQALDTWLAGVREAESVIHYDPDTDEGWFYVPPRPGVDKDIIRVPERVTAKRRLD